MALNDLALVTLIQAKEHLRIDAVASLKVNAEFVGVGDGSDTTFDLDNTPIEGSLKLYVDNVLQVETTDYSISTDTITFVVAPVLNKGITATYDYAASDDTFESYDDLLLEKIIEAATLRAESYTGRAFVQGSLTESKFGDDTDVLKLNSRPVSSITSVVKAMSELVGLGDGTDVTFDLDEVPTADSLCLYVDGTIVTSPTDFTLADATITFDTAPTSGAEITALYTHTIKPISEYTTQIARGQLKGLSNWDSNTVYTVTYIAGYAATRAATQALVPDVVSAVLLIIGYLYENRVDLLKSQSVTGIGSVAFDIPSQANLLLSPYRTGTRWL
jgi:hypothetical protein